MTGDNGTARGGSSDITLRKLRLFWAVAHARSLTRAAKLLGVTQPTLSQQIARLEASLGTPLFERRSNRMILTETGIALLRKSEHVLRAMQELEDGLPLVGGPAHQTVKIAGVTSVMRVLLPAAMQALAPRFPDLEYDIHESAPEEILEMLYARRINIGLLAANSVAEASAGFVPVPVMDDPMVLAVPRALDLSQVVDPERDLDPTARATLNCTIQFVFGNQHSRRVQLWYDAVLPQNRLVAQVRSFEMALDMVAAGLGVCVAPLLATTSDGLARAGIRLYRIGVEPRRIVAMVPSHCRQTEPFATLTTSLQTVARSFAAPICEDFPPFIAATISSTGSVRAAL